MNKKIIIIDTDRRSRYLTEKLLIKSNFKVFTSNNFKEGYNIVSNIMPDIIIIDPLYPKKEGLNFIKSVRDWSHCPIIALSQNGTERAAVEIIDAGADDFIRKPYFSDELLARVRKCIRNTQLIDAAKGSIQDSHYSYNGLLVKFDSNSVFLNNTRIHLTKNEFKIISLLCKNAGKVLTYDYIMKSIWGPQTSNNTGILRVNIANLRKKLEPEPQLEKYIFTENGVGYRMNESQ